MSWQTGTTAASSSYRDFLTSIVAAATSQHISAAVVNSGGTGYTVGDILTITHAGAYISSLLEVTAVSGGVITAIKIRRNGAFSNRAASATVSAGGSGYVVGDILEVQGGTFTEKAKFQVATLSGSAVATVTLFETGGAYTATPSNPAATVGIGPAAFAGNNACTLTVTYTGLIGTTGISATGGTGTGATFDITLTASGHSAVKNVNNRTENSITNEKEVILLGTVAGGDAPYTGFFSYTQTSGLETRRGIAMFGMTGFNPALALSAQPGIGPIAGVLGSSSGSHLPVHEAAREWWLSITGRKISGVIRTTDVTVCYTSFYVGLMNGYGAATTSPYPMFVGASSNVPNRVPDSSDNTGLSECFRATSSGGGPMHFRRKSDGAWVSVINGQNSGTPAQVDDNVMWPVCSVQVVNTSTVPEQQMSDDGPLVLHDGQVGSNTRANATDRMYPAPDSGDDVFALWPLTVLATNATLANDVNLEVAGELDNVFWFGGTTSAGATVAPEDYFDDAVSGKRYRIFPNGTQGVSAKPYQFFCMAEE